MVALLKPIEENLPAWTQVQAGQAKWEDFTFEQRTEKGWLVPMLIDIDLLTHQRWDYWMRTLESGGLLNEPIPRIEWRTFPHKETKKMLEKCLEHWTCNSVARLPEFFEWLLWGFGKQDHRARIDEKVNEHWYRTFNLGLMMQNPYDYLGDLMQEDKGSGRWGNPNAFFATPHTIVECMVRMLMDVDGEKALTPGVNEKDRREESVCDPCVGSGRMLMHASNYSVNLYGVDIDYVCVMACKLNALMYVPWLVVHAPWLAKGEPVEMGDSLRSMEITPTPGEVHEKIVALGRKKNQLTLF